MPIEQTIPTPFTRSDLIFHALAYCGVTILFFLGKFPRLKIALYLLIQGILIEIIQPYFSRHFEFYDILANSLGVLLAIIFFKLKNTFTK